jgi:hypothetical protein
MNMRIAQTIEEIKDAIVEAKEAQETYDDNRQALLGLILGLRESYPDQFETICAQL